VLGIVAQYRRTDEIFLPGRRTCSRDAETPVVQVPTAADVFGRIQKALPDIPKF
jgi:hypothetical protein